MLLTWAAYRLESGRHATSPHRQLPASIVPRLNKNPAQDIRSVGGIFERSKIAFVYLRLSIGT